MLKVLDDMMMMMNYALSGLCVGVDFKIVSPSTLSATAVGGRKANVIARSGA